MDGFRVVKLNEVIRSMDMVITCTGILKNAGVAFSDAFGHLRLHLAVRMLVYEVLEPD